MFKNKQEQLKSKIRVKVEKDNLKIRTKRSNMIRMFTGAQCLLL